MILVDSIIFVDLWTADPRWGDWSADALARAASTQTIGVNAIIYAELCLGFESESELERAFDSAGVRRLPLPYRAAWIAARAYSAYRKRGGARSTPLPDFFIGAHAEAEGMSLLTRDTRRYRTYFPSVRLIAPD